MRTTHGIALCRLSPKLLIYYGIQLVVNKSDCAVAKYHQLPFLGLVDDRPSSCSRSTATSLRQRHLNLTLTDLRTVLALANHIFVDLVLDTTYGALLRVYWLSWHYS